MNNIFLEPCPPSNIYTYVTTIKLRKCFVWEYIHNVLNNPLLISLQCRATVLPILAMTTWHWRHWQLVVLSSLLEIRLVWGKNQVNKINNRITVELNTLFRGHSFVFVWLFTPIQPLQTKCGGRGYIWITRSECLSVNISHKRNFSLMNELILMKLNSVFRCLHCGR